ncbi:MAG: heavy-metal-associated domain-containing protein [Burkholderiales bacterium]|nr:heavy-metal-associated domain-containing protein [Burkholderiales bacterium]
METLNMKISGMTCMGCVGSVKRVLNGIAGVAGAEVSLTPGSATVSYDPAQTNPDALKAAVTEAGYDVS